MSLVGQLMNGGSYGVHIDASKYTHDNGALRIATESAEELHDIFLEFYNYEQAELGAVHEGVALENSSYVAVAESAIGNAVTKIKEFFKKLWEKVKAFFKNIRMHFDAIFMKSKDFVKKYKKAIQDAEKNLKDFEYKMYKYDDQRLNDVDKTIDVDTEVTKTMDMLDAQIKKAATITVGNKKFEGQYGSNDYMKDMDNEGSEDDKSNSTLLISGALSKMLNDSKLNADEDKAAKKFANDIGLKNVTESGDIPEACFAFFRNGATSAEDKEMIDIKSLSPYVGYVEASKVSKVESLGKKTDKMYSEVIKKIDNIESTISKNFKSSGADSEAKKVVSEATQVLRNLSKNYSLVQGFSNTLISAWKTAITERDNTYKSMLVAAMTNANKNKKSK